MLTQVTPTIKSEGSALHLNLVVNSISLSSKENLKHFTLMAKLNNALLDKSLFFS